ncbi:MAG: hypothetical protein U0792_00770 [Gemmataceae bacterium]
MIDGLLESEEFARYWALRTADLLRVNGKTLPGAVPNSSRST